VVPLIVELPFRLPIPRSPPGQASEYCASPTVTNDSSTSIDGTKNGLPGRGPFVLAVHGDTSESLAFSRAAPLYNMERSAHEPIEQSVMCQSSRCKDQVGQENNEIAAAMRRGQPL
jgi:hypothetical protein